MSFIAVGKAVLALPKRYDARLELGGLPAVSALLLAWPISVALIVAVRFASYGEINLSWGTPWIALPLFWPALVLLPLAAHSPTKLIRPAFVLASLTAGNKAWLPLIDIQKILSWRELIKILNSGSTDVLPPLLYGCVIAWLASRRDRSGPTDMRGLRPYRAVVLSLFLLVIIWFAIPLLILAFWLTPAFRVPDPSGLGVFIGIVVGGLIYFFPWITIIVGIVTISMTHGVPRPYGALAFLAVALALCPLDSSLPSANLLTVTLDVRLGMPSFPNYTRLAEDPWRPFVSSAVGVAAYGLSLWLTRRKAVESRPGLEMSLSGSIHDVAGGR